MANRPTAHVPAELPRFFSSSAVLVTIVVLYLARDIFMPLAVAVLFSFVLAPLVTRLERWKLPRAVAVGISALLTLGLVGAIGYTMVGQVLDLSGKLPQYREHLNRKVKALKGTGRDGPLHQAVDTFQTLSEELTRPDAPAKQATGAVGGSNPLGPGGGPPGDAVPVRIVDSSTALTGAVQRLFGPLVAPLGTGAVVAIFTLFILLQREDLRDRLIHLCAQGRLSVTTQAIDEAGHKVTRFLMMQSIVNVSFGVVVGGSLHLAGLPNAGLWGLLAGLLRFVPYVGIWIALLFPLFLSLAVSDAWTLPLLTVGVFVVVDVIVSNALEPWLYGSSTGLSPVAIVLATVFWTWLWGGVGLLLATPLTVCVAVVGRYFPSLRFFPALLGEEAALPIEDRFYQRLLARDPHEAEEIAREFLKEKSLAQLYSEVFVPVLANAKRESRLGELDETRMRSVYDGVRSLAEELGAEAHHVLPQANRRQVAEATGLGDEISSLPLPTPAHPTVVCLPAADEADEIAALMLAVLLESVGHRVDAVSHRELANEMMAHVEASNCRLVCVSVVPPHDHLHARYLCKLLRSRYPNVQMVVGFWCAESDRRQRSWQREKLSADEVVNTLVDLVERARPFVGLEKEAVPEPAAVATVTPTV